MADFIPNIGSQVDRAILALLVADGVVTSDQAFVVTDFRTRPEPPLVDIKTTQCLPEVPFMGTYACSVELFFKFSSVVASSDQDPNGKRRQMDEFVGGVMWSLFRGDHDDGLPTVCTALTNAGRGLAVSDPANNSDMDHFTVSRVRMGAEHRGNPINADGGVEGSYWVEQRTIELSATSANVD